MFNSYYSIRTKEGRPVHTIDVGDLVKRTAKLDQLTPEHWKSSVIRDTIEKLVAAAAEEGKVKSDTLSKKQQQDTRITPQRDWNRAIHHYLRWALAEGKEGLSIADTMEILGREECLARLTRAATMAGSSHEGP